MTRLPLAIRGRVTLVADEHGTYLLVGGRDVSTHAFDPFFEADGGCWCNRGRSHPLHFGTRQYPTTPEQAMPTETPEQKEAFWAAQRASNRTMRAPDVALAARSLRDLAVAR